MGRGARSGRLPGAVLALGLVSLLADVGSEMIFPLLPAFLAQRTQAAPLLLGVMEGLADLVAAACKWWAGKWADRSARLRPLVLWGYTLSAAVRPLWSLVSAWWQPLLIRVADRVGKGARSAPRDAMIAAWVDPGVRARAFGFHRGMDHTGAVLGSLCALALLSRGLSLESVFLLSAIPGALSVLAVFLAREPERPPPPPSQALAPVPRRLLYYLGPVGLFGLTHATDAFLLLRLTEQGAPPELLPLAWFSLHAVKALLSTPAGALADRVGRAKVVLGGWTLHALAFGALAFSPSVRVTFGLVAVYGLYQALAEGAEKALLTELVPAPSRGRAFGLYHALTGAGTLLAGIAFGALWHWSSSRLAFLTAGILALASAGLMVVLLPRARELASAGG